MQAQARMQKGVRVMGMEYESLSWVWPGSRVLGLGLRVSACLHPGEKPAVFVHVVVTGAVRVAFLRTGQPRPPFA